MDIELHSGSLQAAVTVPDHCFVHRVPSAGAGVVTAALQDPLGLPQLSQCVVPGDRVAIVVDPEAPQLVTTINAVWEELQKPDGPEVDATILFPADPSGAGWANVLEELPVHLRSQVAIHIHNPHDEQQCSYLASSAGGERIYLSHYLTDADLIIIVGICGFDASLGYRGTTSAIFPAFSNAETILQQQRSQLDELSQAAQIRNRELVDEIGWLLGSQFSVQVVPDSSGSIATAYAGTAEEVLTRAQHDLEQYWQLPDADPVDTTVICCPHVLPQLSWNQLAAGVKVAAHRTEDGGRVVVMATLSEPDSPSLEMFRRCHDPEDLRERLAEAAVHDHAMVLQLIDVVQNYRVYLFSNLSGDSVEELGIVPVSSATEIQRLIDSAQTAAVLPAAAYAGTRTAPQPIRRR